MITRPISRPVASPIARAVNAPFGGSRAFDPASLFGAGDIGFLGDNPDFKSLYQDSSGTTLVTASGQPVGLRLDNRFGLIRGPELVSAPSSMTGEWISNGDGSYTCSNSVATSDLVFSLAVAGKSYELTFDVTSVAVGLTTYQLSGAPTTITTTGSFHYIRVATVTNLTFRVTVGRSATIRLLSVRELPGNHASQATAAARPILRDGPRRIDYDGVDDALNIAFSASLGSACTVARSIPGVGAQILTGQTIGTSFTDNVDNCALVIINRALTAAETTALTTWLNRRAGV